MQTLGAALEEAGGGGVTVRLGNAEHLRQQRDQEAVFRVLFSS
jgi:hypothetical protein